MNGVEHRMTMLSAYGRAWAGVDEAEVRDLVGRCWAPSGSYTNPFVDPVSGVDGLARVILDYQVLFPGARINSVGRPLFHHDHACWRWALSSSASILVRGANYGYVLTGQDIIRFGADHRILAVVAFFDERCTTRTSFVRPFGHAVTGGTWSSPAARPRPPSRITSADAPGGAVR
jgi:hypothetical protein